MDLALGIAVVIATLAGPVLAVLVTRYIDEKRDKRKRQLDVFRTLMRTRRATLAVEHVGALNMIEIEFHDMPEVMAAFRELHNHFHFSPPAPTDWWDKRSKLQTRLLSAMARKLGYDFEQLDVLEGGYTPTGWTNTEQEQEQLRKLLIELLSGRLSLPVTPGPAITPPPFPPPFPPPPNAT